MAIFTGLAVIGLTMVTHDLNIDNDNWNNGVKTSSIDPITDCATFNNGSLGSNGYWVQYLYYNDVDKFFKDNIEMYNYIENKGKALGCLND